MKPSGAIVATERLAAVDGQSRSPIERVTLEDGRVFVVKRASLNDDPIVRITGDDGRIVRMYEAGIFDELPDSWVPVVRYCERDGDDIVTWMDDVSTSLFPETGKISRDQSRAILRAAADLHAQYRGRPPSLDGMCNVTVWHSVMAPSTLAPMANSWHIAHYAMRGWEVFHEIAPPAVSRAVRDIHADPAGYGALFDGADQTFAHGDLKFGNLGLDGSRLVAVDWGTQTGIYPPATETAWYIAVNATRIDCTKGEIIEDFAEAECEHYDDRAMRLALLGGLSFLGWNKALDSTSAPDPDDRAQEAADFAWWLDRAQDALQLL